MGAPESLCVKTLDTPYVLIIFKYNMKYNIISVYFFVHVKLTRSVYNNGCKHRNIKIMFCGLILVSERSVCLVAINMLLLSILVFR